jgi:hypothetical protein
MNTRNKGRVTGETTDEFRLALEWNCAKFNRKTVFIKNTGLHPLIYKIESQVLEDGCSYTEVADIILNANEVAKFTNNEALSVIKVYVKSQDKNKTSFLIEFFGQY